MVSSIDPEIAEFLADDVIEAKIERQSDGTLSVIISDGYTSDLMLLRRTLEGLVDITEDENSFRVSEYRADSFIGKASAEKHSIIANYAKQQVGVFSTKAGPDGGNLACVWAVRHLIHRKLEYWVTQTDGTAVFAPELLRNYGTSSDLDSVSAGGIVISPSKRIPGTKRRRVGHVGIIGGGSGDTRKVYSNSSSQALWSDRYTIGSWKERYANQLDLPVLFFPLPEFGKYPTLSG